MKIINKNNQDVYDRLFIQEMINDLERNNYGKRT